MSTVSHGSLTPLRFLERSAEVYPDKVAIVHGDRRISYRDFAFEATLAVPAPCGRRGRAGDDHDQLHLGNYGKTQGSHNVHKRIRRLLDQEKVTHLGGAPPAAPFRAASC